uniref:EGF-like domain-containing protein n=1 Tax=Panagrolaimus sp. ES5 TaxID=591445 RepID=A0AC34F344_9BILA
MYMMVIRKSREIPIDLDLGVRAADTTEITYSIPTSITGNGPDGLLQNANALAAQADNLMNVLESLLIHFNDTEGPEIEDVRNMTAQVKAFDADYKEIVALIQQIEQTVANNAKNITYIEKQLTCMKNSGCNTGPTTAPPPIAFDCSVTTQTVSKEGDTGTWTFKNPTEFENCSSLTIKSQRGLWLNINITMGGAGNGHLQIQGDSSGNILFDSETNRSASLIDEPDTQYSIIITEAVTFNVNFKAVAVCTVTNCNFGICSVNAANQPICACKPCYEDNVAANKKCSVHINKCDQYGLFCGDPSYCVPFSNATTCGYYCNCPDMPTDCAIKPTDCDSTTCPEDGGFNSKSFWKRHEDFEDFDPLEFVQQAQEAETTLNFTMPDTIVERDPYVLLADASNLTTLANNLMAQLQTYLDLFNNTQSAPEWNKILPFENRLNNANATFGPLLDRFNDLSIKQNILNSSLEEVSGTLQCYKESNCHITPSTTTAPPPPNYNCLKAKIAKVSAAGDSGSFPFSYINQFQNCSFKIHSNLRFGLWINLQFNNLIIKDPTSTILIETSRDGNFVASQNQTTFSNLHSDDITIYVNGQLQFTINYNAIDPCAGYDCGKGSCAAAAPSNNQTCACQGCYITDGNGRCTVDKPNPCDGNAGLFCKSSGGTCVETLECGYYCKCPQLDPSCQTVEYCEDDVTSCPPPANSRKMPSFITKFLKFFN